MFIKYCCFALIDLANLYLCSFQYLELSLFLHSCPQNDYGIQY